MAESVTSTEDFSQTGPYNSTAGLYTPLPGDEHEQPPSHNTTEGVVYEDKHVIINSSSGILTIKHYILIKPTLKVQIADILWIALAPEVSTRKDLRPWGSGLTGILWARDFSRGGAIVGPHDGYHKSFIFKCKGDKLRSGFSVEDVDAFKAAMEKVVSGVMERHPKTDS